jgi:hypothetical protein
MVEETAVQNERRDGKGRFVLGRAASQSPGGLHYFAQVRTHPGRLPQAARADRAAGDQAHSLKAAQRQEWRGRTGHWPDEAARPEAGRAPRLNKALRAIASGLAGR